MTRKSVFVFVSPATASDFDCSNDDGLTPLFSSCAEDFVERGKSTWLASSRQEHPDLIYGLRETRNLAEALYSPFSKYIRADGGPVLLNEALRVGPFKRIGEPLHFPFLVFQPKSAKSEDFASIAKQTASSIQTLLKMQADLQKKCEQRNNWQEGPLVWFLSNRGENWRLAACSVDNTNGEENYVCLSSFCLISTSTNMQSVYIRSLERSTAHERRRAPATPDHGPYHRLGQKHIQARNHPSSRISFHR